MDMPTQKQQLIASRALCLVLELVDTLGPTEESARQLKAVKTSYRGIIAEFDPQLLTINVTLPPGDDNLEAVRQLVATHIRTAFGGMLGNFSVLTKTDGAFVVVMLTGSSTSQEVKGTAIPAGCHS